MAQRTILLNALAIMLIFVVPTMLATLAFVWWFRPGNTRAERRPNWSFSGRIEVVTWSVPLMTIAFLGGIAWIGSHELDPAKRLPSEKNTFEIQVISLDWKWLFLYPDQKIASLNQLILPVGTPVHFCLTSASVWNAFFIPQLGSMIYTMNGMATQLNLQADREGSFLGLSAHLSGDGFADMRFETRAVSEAAFAEWLKGAQASTQVMDGAAYEALSRQTLDNPPKTFRLADDDLFAKIVGQAIPPGPGPGPGPAMGQPNPSVKPRSTISKQGT